MKASSTPAGPDTCRGMDPSEWRNRREAHLQRLTPSVEAHRARRHRGQSHPVLDFLFTYYSARPATLLRWSPGVGVLLEGPPGNPGSTRAASGSWTEGTRRSILPGFRRNVSPGSDG